MTTIKEKAVEGTTAQSKTKRLYNLSIFSNFSKLVKKKVSRISTSFWRSNYILEENRREHASLGHLWKQIGYCFALLVFRFVGRVIL